LNILKKKHKRETKKSPGLQAYGSARLGHCNEELRHIGGLQA